MTATIGAIVDALGATVTLQDGDLVSDTLVIAKVFEVDGTVRLAIGSSDGMSWVERLGMLVAAGQMETVTGIDGPRE